MPSLSLPADARRRATLRLVLTSFLIAALLTSTILFVGRRVQTRRLELLRVARFDAEAKSLAGAINGMLLGQSSRTDVAPVEAAGRAIEQGADPAILGAFRPICDRFTHAAHRELAALQTRDNRAALKVDIEQFDPSYARLNDEIGRLNRVCDAEANAWGVLSATITGGSLFLCAALVSLLLLRHRQEADALVSLEVRQRTVAASERRLGALIQNNTDVIAVVTPEGLFTMVSDACERAWGREAQGLIGGSVFALIDPSHLVRDRRGLADLIACDAPEATVEIAIRGSAGRRDIEVRVTNLLDDPDVVGILLTFHDLTERKRVEAELAHHAFHDRLTGLPNRALFLDRLAHRLRVKELDDEDFAVLFIDLDNFKVVNDSLGHEAGDTLLVEVAARLQSVVRSTDTVARLGGDEFTIILDETLDSEEAVDVAQRIQACLVRPILLGDREVFVDSSIGVVMARHSGPDAAGLLRDADTAMYEAKGTGKARVALFEASMSLVALDRLDLESDLRNAIAEDRLFLAYQPIVDIATGRPREVEALVRWNHPTRGVIPPGAFIPLAEETGLILAIGRWALRESCAQLSRWNGERLGEEPLALSVNVSARQFAEAGFVEEVRSVLAEFDLDPALVELEVTESAMLNDLSKMKEVFGRLRSLGVRVAIDDFGTGYSSMAYLTQLPVDTLKIDRSFVTPLGQDERADGVVQAMITMAQTLGLGITGEGIETAEQRRLLQEMGCDLGQGYLFDRPLTAAAVTELLEAEAEPPLKLAA